MQNNDREIIPTDKAIGLLNSVLDKAQQEAFDLDSWRSYAISILERIFGANSKKIKEIESIKVGSGFYDADINHRPRAVSIIEASILELETLGVPDKNLQGHSGVLVNVQQNQSLFVNLLRDVMKDELTGKQYKEIQEVVDSDLPVEEKKKTVVEKIKSFGSDVASNIIANLLANSSTYQLFF